MPDFPLTVGLMLLLLIGLISLASASRLDELVLHSSPFARQLLWTGVGLFLAVMLWAVPPRYLDRLILPVYLFSLLTLLGVLFVGQGPAGRWLVLGSQRFQPGELAKAAVLLMLAQVLSAGERRQIPHNLLFKTFIIALLPGLLIALEPDLGTAIVFVVLSVGMLWWRGCPGNWFLWMFAPLVSGMLGFNRVLFLAAMLIILYRILFVKKLRRLWFILGIVTIIFGNLTPVLWRGMPVYQKKRLQSFMQLDQDPHGAAYQVIQSKIAIGSGGLMGKGFGQGTQTQLHFLPEHHTDFILSAFGESFGFTGVMTVLGLWLFVIWRLVRLGERQPALFSRLFFFGLAVIWGFQCFINTAMTMGWAPVTGLPLPFFSYGGSAMMVNLGLSALAIKYSAGKIKFILE